MKTKQRCFSYILMLTLITSTLYAQTIVGKEQHELQKDLYAEALKYAYNTQTESWWDSGNGFICKYASPKGCYMIRYDKQGKYVETLEQKEWSDTAALQPSFQLSQYKSQKVTSYWEVSDVNKKGYYLEMKDSKNTFRVFGSMRREYFPLYLRSIRQNNNLRLGMRVKPQNSLRIRKCAKH